MNMTKVEFPQTFKKQEGQGLLPEYSQENASIQDALSKRLQKLSATKFRDEPDPLQLSNKATL